MRLIYLIDLLRNYICLPKSPFVAFLVLTSMMFSTCTLLGNSSDGIFSRNHEIRLLIGPETYDTFRYREGGTKQHGWLVGGRIICDRLCPYGWYGAVEAAIASGILNGHSGRGAKLKSRMRDRSLEARLGYTIEWKTCARLTCTPFAGVGYYIEDNNYKKPSPLPICFKTSYRYITAGFLLSFCPSPNLTIGLNFKLRQMLDPECKISNDPEFETAFLKIDNDQLQYRAELPIVYRHECYTWAITPFYENRTYGRKAGYPFDFIQTRIFNYGLTFQLVLKI